MMSLNVMDNVGVGFLQSLIQLCVRRAGGSFCGVATIFAALSVAPVTLEAAVLKINAADNPSNTIQVEGPLSATVLHTSEGLEIEIPGVQITLQCDPPAADSCTVTIGGSVAGQVAAVTGASTSTGSVDTSGTGDSSGSQTTGSSGGSTGGSTSGGSATSDSGASTGSATTDPCAGDAPAFGCGDAYSGGGSSSTGDSSDSNTDSGSSSGTNGFDTSGSDDSQTSDPCESKGFNVDPSCESGSSTSADTSTAFPIGSSRRISNIAGTGSRDIDLGSAGNFAGGNTADVAIEQGVVTVVGMTMAAEEYSKNDNGTETRVDPVIGQINFGPVGQVRGGDLRLWISEKPDGDRISEACSYAGYVEASLDVSVDGSRQCNLRSGVSYYMNLALCASDFSDWNCTANNARTAVGKGTLVMEAKYR